MYDLRKDHLIVEFIFILGTTPNFTVLQLQSEEMINVNVMCVFFLIVL